MENQQNSYVTVNDLHLLNAGLVKAFGLSTYHLASACNFSQNVFPTTRPLTRYKLLPGHTDRLETFVLGFGCLVYIMDNTG